MMMMILDGENVNSAETPKADRNKSAVSANIQIDNSTLKN
jgi:hypothetical protein